MGMKLFVRDDEGYLAWVVANPAGYVLNTTGKPSSDYLVLHRATCGQIKSPKRTNYTTGPYIKVCSPDVRELEDWARGETGGSLSPCGLCKPEYPVETSGISDADVRGFEYWIRGYQNFYEPIILAHFRDLGYEASKTGSTIEKNDLKSAAEKLEDGTRKCELDPEEKVDCVKHFRKRSRIQTDGLLHRKDEAGNEVVYSVECKSWGGFCSASDTLKYFMGPGGWFMLVDSIRGKRITGSVLVVGGERPSDHDDLVDRLRTTYGTNVEIHYLREMLANPGLQMRAEIGNQLARLDKCVGNIKKDLKQGFS